MTDFPEKLHNDLYLDLVKRCLLNAVHDPRSAAVAKSVFLTDGTHERLLVELLSTPPDRQNFFAWIQEQVDIICEHGTPEQVARIDSRGIEALSRASVGALEPAMLKDAIQGLQQVTQESLAPLSGATTLKSPRVRKPHPPSS